jgi:hypothetical protein
MGELRNVYRILLGKFRGKRPPPQKMFPVSVLSDVEIGGSEGGRKELIIAHV